MKGGLNIRQVKASNHYNVECNAIVGGVKHIMQVKASNYCNVECNSVWTVLITQA